VIFGDGQFYRKFIFLFSRKFNGTPIRIGYVQGPFDSSFVRLLLCLFHSQFDLVYNFLINVSPYKCLFSPPSLFRVEKEKRNTCSYSVRDASLDLRSNLTHGKFLISLWNNLHGFHNFDDVRFVRVYPFSPFPFIRSYVY